MTRCLLPVSCGNVHGQHPTPIICKETAAVLPFHVLSSHPPPGRCNMIFPQRRWDASWSRPCPAELSLGAALTMPSSANRAGSLMPGAQGPSSQPAPAHHEPTGKASSAKIRTVSFCSQFFKEFLFLMYWERDTKGTKERKRKEEGWS